MSPDHSSAPRSTESRSAILRLARGELPPNGRRFSTFIELFFQLVYFHNGSTDPVNSRRFDAVLFDGFATFHNDWWHIDIVPDHLFPKIDTKGWPSPINPICAVLGGLNTLQMRRQWGQLKDMKRSAKEPHLKCGVAYKAFVLRTLSSRAAHLTSMCICVVLHEDFEISSVINRFNDSFEARAWQVRTGVIPQGSPNGGKCAHLLQGWPEPTLSRR